MYFIKINNSAYPVADIRRITIQNNGATPAAYYLQVELRPLVDYSNSYKGSELQCGTAYVSSAPSYVTFAEADAELAKLLTELNGIQF